MRKDRHLPWARSKQLNQFPNIKSVSWTPEVCVFHMLKSSSRDFLFTLRSPVVNLTSAWITVSKANINSQIHSLIPSLSTSSFSHYKWLIKLCLVFGYNTQAILIFNIIAPCATIYWFFGKDKSVRKLSYLTLHKKKCWSKLISFVPVWEGLYAFKGLCRGIFCKVFCAPSMYYCLYSAVVSICFLEGRFCLKNRISTQSRSVARLECLLLSQVLFESKIGKKLWEKE